MKWKPSIDKSVCEKTINKIRYSIVGSYKPLQTQKPLETTENIRTRFLAVTRVFL